MRKPTAILSVMTALVLLSGMTTAGAQDGVKLKLASYHAANSVFMKPHQFMVDEITKRTDGKVTFETYFGGSLLKAADLYPGLARGVTDIAASVPAAFNPNQYPLSGIALPFITENVYAATMAFGEWARTSPEVEAEYKRGNARLLFGLPAAENVLWSQRKVETAADLKGLRVRTLLGPADVLTALGATAVAVPWTDAIELLQRGGVDAISTTPFEQGVKEGLPAIAAYLSSGGRMGPFAIVATAINLQSWNKLSPETQRIIDEVAAETVQMYMKEHGAAIDEAVEILKKPGNKVQVIEMDPVEEQRWREATQDMVYKKYADAAKKVGADGMALIEKYKQLVAKYEPQFPYQTGIDRYLASK